ncbi:MAG: bifunctional heptose 7-phosphate kinase/heptose 1-phosphate adenyltransferase [Candidatus Acidiferrales bacterium]
MSRPSVDLSRLIELVESFPRQKIAVLADLVADEFVSGEISRVSREAPVLILRHRETQLVPGGGANAANNLTDLGARVMPVGVLGDDAAGRALLDYFRSKQVDTRGILILKGWHTSTKTRFMAGWTHTARQQVLRVDRETGNALTASVTRRLERAARAAASRADALLVSDYGCGAVSPALVRKLRARLVTLDSRYSMLDYAGCGLTAATPNEPELEAIYGTRVGTNVGRLESLGARLLRRLRLKALLVTRGKDGMAVFEPRHKPVHIPVHGSDQVADVTGAGDTVIAAFTLALAAGATFVEAAQLANYAGGIVVMKRGTATVSRNELLEAITDDLTGRAAPQSK